MMNEEKLGLLETIKICDEELNKEDSDARYGEHLIDSVIELWRMKILKNIDEQSNL